MATINDHVYFREDQRMTQWWLWAIVLAVAGLCWFAFIWQVFLGHPLGNRPAPDAVVWVLWLLIGIGLPLLLESARLTVEVRDNGLRIKYFPFFTRWIAYDEITSCEPRKYRPIWDYGGWGIRWRPSKGWVYSTSGNQGVLLTMTDGRKLMIGSHRPQELANAIRSRQTINV